MRLTQVYLFLYLGIFAYCFLLMYYKDMLLNIYNIIRRFAMINRKIKKVVLSLIGISFSLFLVYIAFYMYVEFKGYPWEHLKLKGEAIKYMDTKYNMKVKVVRTSFNFKFDSYSVKVYNINDKNKTLINVETGYSNEGLRDNYSMVYWQKKLTD